MKADIKVDFGKIGVDDDTLQVMKEYTNVQSKGLKKTYRFEVGEEAKGVVTGFVTIGVLGILCFTATSIFKTIYGTGS